MSEKYKKKYKFKLCWTLTVTGCVSISAFTSLVAIPVGIPSMQELKNISQL